MESIEHLPGIFGFYFRVILHILWTCGPAGTRGGIIVHVGFVIPSVVDVYPRVSCNVPLVRARSYARLYIVRNARCIPRHSYARYAFRVDLTSMCRVINAHYVI